MVLNIKINSFVEFRKELLADGWQPVANPDCHALLGVNEFCSVIPETTWASGTGDYVLHFIKDGTPLSVTLYGEIEALEKPDTSGSLGVTGWEYTTRTDDFIPEETDPTYNIAYRKDKQLAGQKLTLRELSVIAGVDCKDADKGLDCTTGNYEVGDYYDVKLSPDCGQNGLFAAVINKKGTELLDRAPPKDTTSLATLSEGQLVCIQATAHIKDVPSWYYVTVVPVESFEGCSGTELCAKYGNRKMKWHVKHDSNTCQPDGPGKFLAACAAGWTYAEGLSVF